MRIKLLISSSVVPQSEDYTQPLCLPCRLWDSFIPRQVHRGDGVQGHRLLSSGLKRWLQSIPEEQRSVESLRSPTTLGCSPPIPLFHKKGKWEGKVMLVVFLQWVRHKAQTIPG